MQLFIKTIDGKTLLIETQKDSTVLEFKQDIYRQYNFPIDKQTIVVCGKKVEDEVKLSSFSPQTLAVINILLNKD